MKVNSPRATLIMVSFLSLVIIVAQIVFLVDQSNSVKIDEESSARKLLDSTDAVCVMSEESYGIRFVCLDAKGGRHEMISNGSM